VYQRILVPVDDSTQARRGLQEAVKIALSHGSKIRLVHVLDQTPLARPEMTGPRFDEVFERSRQDGLLLLANAELYVRHAGVLVDTRLVEVADAGPAPCIVQQALEWPADLIVCGTHGRHGLARMLLGSQAEEILRQSPVPMLLVPQHSSQSACRPKQPLSSVR
jgi:nucleotide-binding universal stress UspA family protein